MLTSDMPNQVDNWWMPAAPSGIETTTAAASNLDEGGGLWDSMTGSLSKLLDAYTSIEVSKAQQQLPSAGVPVGYMRVPGTNNVVPAGTMAAQGGFSTSALLMIGGGVLLLVLLLKKG